MFHTEILKCLFTYLVNFFALFERRFFVSYHIYKNVENENKNKIYAKFLNYKKNYQITNTGVVRVTVFVKAFILRVRNIFMIFLEKHKIQKFHTQLVG
jgi:hypothetical protein